MSSSRAEPSRRRSGQYQSIISETSPMGRTTIARKGQRDLEDRLRVKIVNRALCLSVCLIMRHGLLGKRFHSSPLASFSARKMTATLTADGTECNTQWTQHITRGDGTGQHSTTRLRPLLEGLIDPFYMLSLNPSILFLFAIISQQKFGDVVVTNELTNASKTFLNVTTRLWWKVV